MLLDNANEVKNTHILKYDRALSVSLTQSPGGIFVVISRISVPAIAGPILEVSLIYLL